MNDYAVAVAAGITVLALVSFLSASSLGLANAFVRAWVWMLTLGLPSEVSQARRDVVTSDLWEHREDARAEGYTPPQIACQVLARLVLGVPNDISWRLAKVELDYPLLAVPTVMVGAVGVVVFGAGSPLAVLQWLVAMGALALLVGVCVSRYGRNFLQRTRTRKTLVNPRLDWIIVVSAVTLTAIGVLAVASSSAPLGESEHGSPHYYLVRHSAYVAIGIVAMIALMCTDRYVLYRLSVGLLALAILGLVAVLLPHVGVEEGGAARQVDLGVVRFQPSEFAKLAMIAYLAAWLASRGTSIARFSIGFVPFVLMMGISGGLILAEPDISTALVVFLVCASLFFAAGAPLSHLGLLLGVTATFAAMLLQSDYTLWRLASFLDPHSDPQGVGFQTLQLIQAVSDGGVTGVGLGASEHKAILPSAHSHGILAIIAEEVGFVGVACVVSLYALLVYRGLYAAIRARDTFSSLLALGITTWIGFQALLNIGGVVRLIPITGLPLPLVSYGASSLISTLAAVGVLVSISRGVGVRSEIASGDYRASSVADQLTAG